MTETPQIFFSYSRTDWAMAKPVLDALEAEGFTVWWDGLLEAGSIYTQTTESALENAKAVVVLWSKTSVDSHWVRDEAQSGRDSKRLVPLSLDGTMPPLGFRQFQSIDISGAKGDPAHPAMRNALQAIAQLVAPGSEPAQASFTAPASALFAAPVTPPKAGLSRRNLMLGGGTIALSGAAALAAWQAGLIGTSTESGIVSLAILPFKNLSGDPDKAYFSEGLSEELRAALGAIPGLQVAAQASSNKVGEDNAEPVDIAKKLKVGYLLEGSVRLIGSDLRISAQLIDGKTGFDGWTETYDRTLADIFAVQSDIAERVAAELAIAIPALGNKGTNRAGSTNNPAALDSYLRGRALYELAADETTDRAALAQFEAAIAADPQYAVAWAAKSRAQTTIANIYTANAEVGPLYDQAIASARQATILEPALADGYAALGYVLLNGRLDVAAASTAYEKAYEFGRANADILQAYATFMARNGKFAEARSAIIRAAELDPLNPDTLRTQGMIAFTARDYPAAKRAIKQALELNPEMSSAHGWLGDIAYFEGDNSAALALFNKEPSTLNRLRGLAVIQQAMGDTNAAGKALSDMRAKYGTNALYQEAEIYAQWGNKDQAIRALEAAYKAGDSGLVLARGDRLLDPLRDDSRFITLLRRIGFR